MTVPWNKGRRPEYLKDEIRQAKRPGARRQINSGRLWFSLRDVIEKTKVGTLLIDNKTGKDGPLKSYRITEKEWDEIHRDANRTPPGCHPVLRLNIGRYRLMVIEEDLWDDVGDMLTNA